LPLEIDMADTVVQRKNMVESQVRPSDVTDRRIARAMLELPREEFVPKQVRSLAYMDSQIPLQPEAGRGGRALTEARTLAKLIQLCDVQPSDMVLLVGAATGYSAAVLSRLAQTVVALETDEQLAQEAIRALQALSLDNVVVVQGQLSSGYASEGPYDAILIDGSVEVVPDSILGQLKDGGRLAAVVHDNRTSRAVVWRRTGTTTAQSYGFDASAPQLPGFERASSFVF
jgi:protein-L-isoaspartate(D-aspartate) O-methyltransferase